LRWVDGGCAYISGEWKVGIKEIRGSCLLEIGARTTPFGLDTVDQVWPENFGGFYKAPAVDLVNGVYMGVQEEDQ
jgi:hypothetical protein